MLLLISSEYAFHVCGIRREISEICKCYSDELVYIFSNNPLKDDYFSELSNVRVFDNFDVLRRYLSGRDIDIYFQFGTMGRDALDFGLIELEKALKLFITGGFLTDSQRLFSFDYIIYQANNTNEYIDGHEEKKIVIPPPLTKKKDITEIGSIDIPEDFYFTLFNPYPIRYQKKEYLKGQDVLIRIAERINKKIIWVYSTDEQGFPEYNNISGNVVVLKNLNSVQISYLYQNATAYISFSRSESFSWSILDAIVHNLPVISKDVGIMTLFDSEKGIYKYNNIEELLRIINNGILERSSINLDIFSCYNYKRKINDLIERKRNL